MKGIEILKIAVTGSAGSGKSLVGRRLVEKGLVVLDSDVIAREVTLPGGRGLEKIIECFGPGVLTEKGELNRAGLRKIIIKRPEKRKQLEAILHPMIGERMEESMEKARIRGEKAVVVEIPLLFESGMDKLFDISVVVTASSGDLAERIMVRDRMTREEALRMLDIQMPQEEKIKRADHVIENCGTRAELFDSVDNFFSEIIKRYLTIKSL